MERAERFDAAGHAIRIGFRADAVLTVKRSHAVAVEARRLICDRIPNMGDVMIHINPHEEAHEDMIRL